MDVQIQESTRANLVSQGHNGCFTGDLHIGYVTEEDIGTYEAMDSTLYICNAWTVDHREILISKVLVSFPTTTEAQNTTAGSPAKPINPPGLVYPTSSEDQTCIAGQRCVLRCFTKGMLVSLHCNH